MPWLGLGALTVATPGVKVRLTANQTDPTATIHCQALMIQAFSNASHTNTGRIYLYDASNTRIATLPVPTTNTIPSASGTIPSAPGPMNAADFSIDADNSGDGVDASYTSL